MIKEFKHETIIITKEAFFYLKAENRKKAQCSPLSEEQLEKAWERIRYKNRGASMEKHPITDNELRISPDCFNFRFDQIKEMLTANGFTFRQDGFIEEGCYM